MKKKNPNMMGLDQFIRENEDKHYNEKMKPLLTITVGEIESEEEKKKKKKSE